jgi:hypothetical protein
VQPCQQYSVPGLFKEDLFQLAGERRRPPYRFVSSTHFCAVPTPSPGLHADAIVKHIVLCCAVLCSLPSTTWPAAEVLSSLLCMQVVCGGSCAQRHRPAHRPPGLHAVSNVKHTELSSAVLCCAVLCCAVLFCSVLCCEACQAPLEHHLAGDVASMCMQVVRDGPCSQRHRPAHRPPGHQCLERAAGWPQALGTVPARHTAGGESGPVDQLVQSMIVRVVVAAGDVLLSQPGTVSTRHTARRLEVKSSGYTSITVAA